MIYIDSNSTDVYFNFALEYYLISEKKFDDDIFLFWRTDPTLMIGKYQNTLEEINEKYVKENNINVVRRMSGGGTIYTDKGGWQFTFITKNKSEQISFTQYITPIIKALKSLEINAGFNGRNDLVIDGKKFSGNAQYIHNGYTLHHGSLLYNTNIEQMVKSTTVNEYKIISKGIKSVRDRVTNISEHIKNPISSEEFKNLMVKSIMCNTKNEYSLTEYDKNRINKIADEKFRSWEKIYGASPKFNITRSGHFQGGNIDFKLDINKGKIMSISVFGDFFGSDTDEFCKCLIGCNYNRNDIENALKKIDIENLFYKITKEEILNCLV